jgi:hypothetical protein
MRASFKHYVLGFALFIVALAGVLCFGMRPKPIPPLPFDAKVFIASTSPYAGIFTPPPNASVFTRARYFIFFDLPQKFRGKNSSTWSFGASPKTGCSIQGLLNQCDSVCGTRYLMPLSVAVGIVQFGNTNTLNGPQWVAAFESALQTGDVQIFDQQTKRTHADHLALLRFPAQKTVVVLPESDAADFLRTNGIHLPDIR